MDPELRPSFELRFIQHLDGLVEGILGGSYRANRSLPSPQGRLEAITLALLADEGYVELFFEGANYGITDRGRQLYEQAYRKDS